MKKNKDHYPFSFREGFKKQLLIMKLTIVLLLIGVLQLSATVYSQNEVVKLSKKEMTMREVFKEVENNSQYRFFFNDLLTNIDRKVNLKSEKMSIKELLGDLLSNTNLNYKLLQNNLIVISPKDLLSIKITGTVTDSKDGQPLPGASILIKGSSTGVITDLDGNFSIEVPDAKAVLQVSFIGYTTQTIEVGEQTVINVQLVAETKNINEVVVVGYGKMKRGDLTGSVVSMGEDAIKKAVPTTIDNILIGRLAGVNVLPNSGTPGSTSSIRIRGTSSLNASNEPIFVIDGVILDDASAISSINPSDIVSVDVLKDASATAIYGSRAANGVIQITTRQGKNGSVIISYDGKTGWQEIPTKMDLLNLQEYAIHKNKRTDAGIVMPDNYFVRADLLGKGTDWQNELFRKAMLQSHNLTVSGGTEKTLYSMGIGYLNQEGIAIGSGFDRLNLSGKVEAKATDFLKFGINFAFNNSHQQTTVNDASLIKIALKQTPGVAVRNADGNFDGPDTKDYVQTNPIGLALLKDDKNEKFGIRGTAFSEAEIYKGLTFRTEYAFDYGINTAFTFSPSYEFGALVNNTREGTSSESYSKYWSWKNILTYNKSYGAHSLTMMLGQEMQKSNWKYLYGYRSGYLSNGATDLSAGDALTARNSNSSGESSISSYFGRLFYSFNDKYLITTTLRRDGSSKFYKDNRWGWFPSAALAWKVSNEDFLKDLTAISNLKLRLGWGAVGNQRIQDYAFVTMYSSVATNWGTGLLASNISNKDLQWETTNSSNIGFDLGILKNRIELVVDLYQKKTDNLLMQLPLPAYVGTSGQGSSSAPWVNIGSIENKGIELTLNTINLDKGDFSWRSSFVFTKNKNKVLSLDTETSILNRTLQEGSDVNILTRTAVGQPVGQYYGYKVIGRFEKATDFYYKNSKGEVVPTALPEGMSIGENSVWIGDYIFEDINKDGVINEQDRTYIGNPEPKFTFGFGNTFTYKGFDLNIHLSGAYGNEAVNYQRRWLENPSENTNLLSSALDYAKLELINPAGPEDYRNLKIVGGDASMPRMAASSASSTSNYRFSNRFVEDASFIRIQNISLGYTLPKSLVSRVKLQNLRVYATLQNVFTFTNYSGYDPEIGALNGDGLLIGIDNARYPSPRMYTFGLNITL
jgi:TonB-dependent starch-binding outer membrane protein SusC